MKDGVILVNTSRGGLVKTDDLIEGIRARKFFGVGLDVYEEKPRTYSRTVPMRFWSTPPQHVSCPSRTL